jgi:hypothetical protein
VLTDDVKDRVRALGAGLRARDGRAMTADRVLSALRESGEGARHRF